MKYSQCCYAIMNNGICSACHKTAKGMDLDINTEIPIGELLMSPLFENYINSSISPVQTLYVISASAPDKKEIHVNYILAR